MENKSKYRLAEELTGGDRRRFFAAKRLADDTRAKLIASFDKYRLYYKKDEELQNKLFNMKIELGIRDW